MAATFTLSAFGDEIAPDLQTQLEQLNALNIGRLELRTAFETNVRDLSDSEVRKVKQMCQEHDITVSCIGSPIGKSPIEAPIENEVQALERLMDIGDALDTKNIRIFSFYPPEGVSSADFDQYIDEVVNRLKRLAEVAAPRDFVLLLENEKDIVGDTGARCHTILERVKHNNLRFIWDPANFVQVGEANQVEDHWDALGEYVGYVHIKDAGSSDGQVVPPGEGDGQLEALLINLRDSGYTGVLALEPHLVEAGHSTGFSGTGGIKVAADALRRLLDTIGVPDVQA